MIWSAPPPDFDPDFNVTGCFFDHNGKILLLLRHSDATQGNTWCVPGGKIDDGEEAIVSVIREMNEETGIGLGRDDIEFKESIYIRYPEYDFVYHIFSSSIDNKPTVTLNPREHSEYRWVRPAAAAKLDLIPDLAACLARHYESVS